MTKKFHTTDSPIDSFLQTGFNIGAARLRQKRTVIELLEVGLGKIKEASAIKRAGVTPVYMFDYTKKQGESIGGDQVVELTTSIGYININISAGCKIHHSLVPLTDYKASANNIEKILQIFSNEAVLRGLVPAPTPAPKAKKPRRSPLSFLNRK